MTDFEKMDKNASGFCFCSGRWHNYFFTENVMYCMPYIISILGMFIGFCTDCATVGYGYVKETTTNTFYIGDVKYRVENHGLNTDDSAAIFYDIYGNISAIKAR